MPNGVEKLMKGSGEIGFVYILRKLVEVLGIVSLY